ncbi:hypothetical protein H8E50_04340, partial [bacterium]|nr:hypothetical protein [bacterium]
LCDTLSKIRGITNITTLKISLFEDLRIEREELSAINIKDIEMLEPLYKKKVLALFLQYLHKEVALA